MDIKKSSNVVMSRESLKCPWARLVQGWLKFQSLAQQGCWPVADPRSDLPMEDFPLGTTDSGVVMDCCVIGTQKGVFFWNSWCDIFSFLCCVVVRYYIVRRLVRSDLRSSLPWYYRGQNQNKGFKLCVADLLAANAPGFPASPQGSADTILRAPGP